MRAPISNCQINVINKWKTTAALEKVSRFILPNKPKNYSKIFLIKAQIKNKNNNVY